MRGLWILIRSMVLWGLCLSITFGLLVLSIPLIVLRLGRPMFRVGVWWAHAMTWLLRAPVTVEGLERLHRDGPVIIISNHQSMLDIPALMAALPLRYGFMAKASLFKIPLFGGGMRAIQCIPVDRDNAARARESMFRAAETVRGGTSVVVFPEGTRGLSDGVMRPFKGGGFIMAQKAGVVIQPLTIWGASNVSTKDERHWVQRLHASPICLVVHDPILPADFAGQTPQELSARLRTIIEAPMERLRKEIPIRK